MYVADFEFDDTRDGILVERLVKTMRHVADMRRCQYVVQRPEGGDGGSGPMSNTSIAAAICSFSKTLIKACSSTIGPRDGLINQAVGSHSLQLRGPHKAACSAAQQQLHRLESARSDS